MVLPSQTISVEAAGIEAEFREAGGDVGVEVVGEERGGLSESAPPQNPTLEIEDGLLVDLEESDVLIAVLVSPHVEAAAEQHDLAGAGRDPALDEAVEVAGAEADHGGRRRKGDVQLPRGATGALVGEPSGVRVAEQRLRLFILQRADGRDDECGRPDFVDVGHLAPLSKAQ